MLFHACRHIDSVGDTVRVCNDDRRAVIRFGFYKRFQRLFVPGTHRDTCHIGVAVGHGNHAQVFFGHRSSGSSEFRDRSFRCRFRCLSTGVRVNFGVEHNQVDVLAARGDMVYPAVPDIVGPAVATDAPDAFFCQHVGDWHKIFSFDPIDAFEFFLEYRYPLTLLEYIRLGILLCFDNLFCQGFANF